MTSFDPRRRARPTLEQTTEVAGELVDLAHLARSQVVALDGRRRSVTRLPYRSSTRFDGSGGSGGHGDPVGELVAGNVDADAEQRGPVRKAYAELVDAIEAAGVLLRSAVAGATAVLHPERAQKPDDEGCTSCAAHGLRGVPTRSPGGDLCRWCADFWRRHRQRPSKQDIEAREARRIHREQQERLAA